MSAANDAKDLVNNFAARTGTGVWLHIDRADLAQGLRARIDNPDLINQGQASLCGPADFFHDLAIDDPVTYARAAIELYETGATNVGTQKIRPSHDFEDSFDSGKRQRRSCGLDSLCQPARSR